MTSIGSALLLACAIAIALPACQGDEPTHATPDSTCPQGTCGAQSRADLLASIDGFADPFSTYLRAEVSEDGSILGDYQDILKGVGALNSCSQEEERSFVVLSNTGFTPRTIFTQCSRQPAEASRFFLLAPVVREGPDLDPKELHLAAWDEDAGRYRHFSTSQDDQGEMRVATEPAHCLGCHGGTEPLPYWQPLMNEMRNPWSQWNAAPAFTSHSFDEYIDTGFKDAPVFQAMRAEGRLHSASDLEPIVRAGIARVVGKRIQEAGHDANLESAQRLLRPVFCDETVNFASEIHESGELASAVVVDDALRGLLASMRPGAWNFLSETRFRIPIPTQSEDRVLLMPIRGESSVAAEASLVTRQILSPEDILRVRLLDFQKPMGSSFRCGLFDSGKERVAQGVLDSAIQSLPEDGINAELVRLLYFEMMHWVSADGVRRSLTVTEEAAEGRKLLAIADMQSPEAKAFLATADPGGLVMSIDEIGSTLQRNLDEASRDELLADRRDRYCQTQQWFAGTPEVPGLICE